MPDTHTHIQDEAERPLDSSESFEPAEPLSAEKFEQVLNLLLERVQEAALLRAQYDLARVLTPGPSSSDAVQTLVRVDHESAMEGVTQFREWLLDWARRAAASLDGPQGSLKENLIDPEDSPELTEDQKKFAAESGQAHFDLAIHRMRDEGRHQRAEAFLKHRQAHLANSTEEEADNA
ncbi:hypothetical protein [Nesterenkonia rhizosphaerae]|uniref:DUF222 domain-containing protein n=1 Tax=Nesterenkonia rhizosphaerae TaxID=1348272 RepID=A0ABP9FSE8_9MICC